MAKCKYCGRSGLFLKITSKGLCNSCNPIVTMDIMRSINILNDSLKIVEASKKLDTKLSRCDLIIKITSAMIKYEECGIPTFDPLPSVLLKKYTAMRDQIIFDTFETDFNNLRYKIEVISNAKTKVNMLSKLLLEIRNYKLKANNPKILDTIEQQVSQLIQKIQLSSYIEEAKRAEFKGQKKKALDRYYEALYFIKHDEIDDSLQQESIRFIESKIVELGGNIA